MGVAQCVRHLAGDLNRFLERQLLLAIQSGAQCFSIDEGHHVIQKAGGFSRVVEGQDVWVREARRDFDLAEEPLRTERGSELGLQHLDGDLAMVLQVLGEIDRRHPAAAQLSLDQVTVGECRLERREHVRHAAARSWVWLNHRTRPESGPAPTRYN